MKLRLCAFLACLLHICAADNYWSVAGDPNRLIYAIDSRGMLCGSVNTHENTTVDLTDKPNLYYLNALDLLKVSNLMYAKTICVSSCPTPQELCSIGQLPCTRNEQYM
jgi:choline transporter-like protein 2/4/5